MIVGKKVILREKRLADARHDYDWETDPELAQLDAAPVLVITFSEYLSEYAAQLQNPPRISRRYSIETLDGKHIGNCSYYNINEDSGEAELGIMIGNRDYWDNGYGTDAVTTLVNHIFRQTNIERIYLKTLKSNSRAQNCFQKCGFIQCGDLDRDGYSFSLMEIYCKPEQESEAGT